MYRLMASDPHLPINWTASTEYPSRVRNCAPETRQECWENRCNGSPEGPGLSMVVPVFWMVSRKICTIWVWEMVCPSGPGIRGMPVGRSIWAGNQWRRVARCLIIAWCGHRARRCGAVRHKQECPRETHAPVVSFFWTGRVMNVVFSSRVFWCHTCLVEAAAASMPRSSHQQHQGCISRVARVFRPVMGFSSQ